MNSPFQEVSIDLQGFFPDLLFVPDEFPTELWVFGHDATGQFAVRSLTDTNGNGVVDVASSQTLFTGDRPDRVESVAFHGASGSLYMKEATTGHIFKAIDTDDDDRPDQLLVVPFLDAAWTGPPGKRGPFDDEPQYADIEDPVSGDPVSIPAAWMLLSDGIVDAEEDRVRVLLLDKWFVDTDGDNVADDMLDVIQVKTPFFAGLLIDGLTRVQVGGEDAVTLEMLDAAGTVVGQVTAGGWIQLSTPLGHGQQFRVRDATNGVESQLEIVSERRVYAHEVGVVTDGTAQTVTITGANLDLVTSVELRRDGYSQAVTYQAISSSELRVNLPQMGTEWDANTELVLAPQGPIDSSDPETHPDSVGVERCPH